MTLIEVIGWASGPSAVGLWIGLTRGAKWYVGWRARRADRQTEINRELGLATIAERAAERERESKREERTEERLWDRVDRLDKRLDDCEERHDRQEKRGDECEERSKAQGTQIAKLAADSLDKDEKIKELQAMIVRRDADLTGKIRLETRKEVRRLSDPRGIPVQGETIDVVKQPIGAVTPKKKPHP